MFDVPLGPVAPANLVAKRLSSGHVRGMPFDPSRFKLWKYDVAQEHQPFRRRFQWRALRAPAADH
jgi:hypothetical protein